MFGGFMYKNIFIMWSVILIMANTAIAKEAGKTEYLSDRLDIIMSNSQSWGQLGIDKAAHNIGVEALPLQVKDKVYTKGLGTHAEGEIIILLDGKYSLFQSEAGAQYQNGSPASVVFRVVVDGKKKFESKVLTESDDPVPVKVSLVGAHELRLEIKDGGDGIICDLGNWLNARITSNPDISPEKVEFANAAPFAKIVTSDPERMDGARKNRLQEFDEDDLLLDVDVVPSDDNTYKVPAYKNNKSVIGLRWLERRRLYDVDIEFEEGSYIPSPNESSLQLWIMSATGGSPGGSAWQGNWVPVQGNIEKKGNKLRYIVGPEEYKLSQKGFLKLRWVFDGAEKPIIVKSMTAITSSKVETADIQLQMENVEAGKQANVEMYNGYISTSDGDATTSVWNDVSKPLKLKIRYNDTKYLKFDRTVIRLKLPTGDIAVAVDDILANPCVYVPDYSLFATSIPAKVSLEEYKKKIAKKKTILEQVRSMPDQTLAQAMEKLHPKRADTGPTMLSLAGSNRKYVVQRNGMIEFEQSEHFNNLIHQQGGYYNCCIVPIFGSGKANKLKRKLQNDWMPIPVITVKDGGIVYKQRSYVAPYEKNTAADMPVWYNEKPLFVAEITMENPGKKDTEASLALDFIGDVLSAKKMDVRLTDFGVIAHEPDKALAAVNTEGLVGFESVLKNGALTLKGNLKPKSQVKCYVYIPGWEIDSEDLSSIKITDGLVSDTEKYWKKVMAPAMQFDIPDKLLKNVIMASQVHCWLAARNVDNKLISPWVGSINYGPLDSEAQSVVRGMEFMGQEEFARRSFDYFISLYNEEGYIRPLYTLMGTGWHLWILGEFFELYNDTEWMKKNASEVARVCDWIMRQRNITKKLDAKGEKLPEYGLNPPGAMADWEVFSYYFCSNGYFHAGLNSAAKALQSIGYKGADEIAADAKDYRNQIERAFKYVQSKAPVFKLRDGAWIPPHPTQLYCPALVEDFYPGEDFGRSWCYYVELGAHHLVPLGVIDPNSKDAEWMMDYLEDVQFLRDGWFDYPHEKNIKDPFNFGGFAKVQPYYGRNAEICAMRDDVKPFIRSYFNTMPTSLNSDDLSIWEHFNASGAWNKTHETGNFLHQSRTMFVMERGNELWLAPFITNNWMNNGETISVRKAPTKFGKVDYTIKSYVDNGCIEARIKAPTRSAPEAIVIRLRHPEDKKMKSVIVDGARWIDFDAKKEIVRIPYKIGYTDVKANY